MQKYILYALAIMLGVLLAANFVGSNEQGRNLVQTQVNKVQFFKYGQGLCEAKVKELSKKTGIELRVTDLELLERLTREDNTSKGICYGWLGDLLNADFAEKAEFEGYPKVQTN